MGMNCLEQKKQQGKQENIMKEMIIVLRLALFETFHGLVGIVTFIIVGIAFDYWY